MSQDDRTEPPSSAAALWSPLGRFVAREARLGAWAAKRPATAFVYEFLRFGVKEAWACLFGALMLALLAGTFLWYPKGAALARYDFLVIASVALQIGLIALRFETLEEAKVILIFHVVGTAMEVYKTATGSWIYPGTSVLRIAGVPLFTGFMYAAIGSYMTRAWRLFDFRFSHHPPMWAVTALAAAIYANFFLDHFGIDGRLPLFAASIAVFGRGWIYFKPWRVHRACRFSSPTGSAHCSSGSPKISARSCAPRLSRADARLVDGQRRQIRLVVSAADHQLRDRRGDPAAPALSGIELTSGARRSRQATTPML